MELRPVPKIHPGLIGYVIVVQGFNKSVENEGEIVPDSLKKSVGKLKSYSLGNTYDTIVIDGLGAIRSYHETQTYEVFFVVNANAW